jgi:hypothetical protein
MKQEHLRVIYDGPALQQNTMDVRDLAPALLAIGDIFQEANYVLNGERAKITVQVKASFQTGCFGIDLQVVQSFMDQVTDIFSNRNVTTAKQILDWIGITPKEVAVGVGGGLFWLIKKLRGRKPKLVKLLDNGSVEIFVDDESFAIEQEVLELYRHFKLRKALQAAITNPMEREGIDSFAVETEKGRFVEVTKREAGWFVAPVLEAENIDQSELETNLQLVNIAFRDDNKWRFSDGAGTFYAAIEDDRFISQVDKNEISFSKGDILRVRLHKRQWLSGEDMKTEYTVKEVLSHRKASVQLKLPLEPPPGYGDWS